MREKRERSASGSWEGLAGRGVQDSQGDKLVQNCGQGAEPASKRQGEGEAEGPGQVERVIGGAQVME